MPSRISFAVVRRFARNRNGNTAIMFCLAAIPFFGVLGVAIDFGLGLADKSKLDGAADAAALAAIRVAQNSIQAGASRTDAMAAGTAQALTAFKANAGTLAFGVTPTPKPTWTAGSSGQTLSATVTYSMVMTNTFAKLIGQPTTTIQGTSSATLTMPTFINYYIVTDISQSMGVGATATDMANLYQRVITYSNYDTQQSKNTKTGCVFGCHVQQSTGGYTQPVSNETLAHSLTYGAPITLRIDSAKAAIQSIIGDAQSANQKAGQNLVQIGIWTMQQDPQHSGSYIQTIMAPPTSNFAVLSAKVTANMDLGENNGGGTGDSGFTNSLDYFVQNILPAQGDGSSAASPLNYVFLITDGLSDVPGACTDGHCTGAFDDTLCTPIRTKATVGLIYTTYNPIYANPNDPTSGLVQTYKDLVQPYVGSIPNNLQTCASGSQYYFEAQDGPAITTAMQNLFAITSQPARLSR